MTYLISKGTHCITYRRSLANIAVANAANDPPPPPPPLLIADKPHNAEDAEMQKAIAASYADKQSAGDAELARAMQLRWVTCVLSANQRMLLELVLQTTSTGIGGGAGGGAVVDADIGIALTAEERQMNEAVLKCSLTILRIASLCDLRLIFAALNKDVGSVDTTSALVIMSRLLSFE